MEFDHNRLFAELYLYYFLRKLELDSTSTDMWVSETMIKKCNNFKQFETGQWKNGDLNWEKGFI